MKTSLIWATIAVTSLLLLMVTYMAIRRNINESKKEYMLARRRVGEQIAAFQASDYKKSGKIQPLRVVTHNDNERNVEEKYKKSA